jgi:hypothetical protein
MATTSKTARPKRRRLRFNSFEEMFVEIESLRDRPHQQLGNWSLPTIIEHLSRSISLSIDGGTFPVPWFLRLIGPWLIKPRALSRGLPRGFQLPSVARKRLIPEDRPACDEALARLRGSVERFNIERPTNKHPVMGRLNAEEWNQFHLRHAELHLGFLAPE